MEPKEGHGAPLAPCIWVLHVCTSMLHMCMQLTSSWIAIRAGSCCLGFRISMLHICMQPSGFSLSFGVLFCPCAFVLPCWPSDIVGSSLAGKLCGLSGACFSLVPLWGCPFCCAVYLLTGHVWPTMPSCIKQQGSTDGNGSTRFCTCLGKMGSTTFQQLTRRFHNAKHSARSNPSSGKLMRVGWMLA